MRAALLVLFGFCVSPALGVPIECSLGVRAAKDERHQEAVALYSTCLEEKNLSTADRARSLRNRALAYSHVGAFAKSIGDQKNAIELESPRTVWPYVMLSMYLRELKRFDEALTALEMANKLDEDGPGSGPGMAVSYHRGQTLHRLERYVEAIASYTKGLEKQPDYAYAYYRRGLAYEAAGKRLEAEKDMQTSARYEPKDGFEEDVARKLREYKVDVRKTRSEKLDR